MRTVDSAKNIATSMLTQMVMPILNFVSKTVFIIVLTKEYLGINSLFSSVFTILSLSELGIGTAIVYAMYRPVAENDIEKIKSLMQLYRKAYRLIGFFFAGVGILLLPIVPILAKGGTDLVNIRVIFLLHIFSSACSYWFFAYKSAILSATQKNYKLTAINILVSVLTTVSEIVVLLVLRKTPKVAFYTYTVLGILMKIVKNLWCCAKVNRMYPYLKDRNVRPLTKEEKEPIYKNILGTAANKVCWKLNDGIDSTVISAFAGVAVTGVFSNYIHIKTIINKLISSIFGPMQASIGNFCAVESDERKENFFYALNFSYFWLYGFSAICLWILFQPFIGGIWLRDKSWLLSEFDMTLLCFNYLIEGLAGAMVKYRDVHGLYYETRYRYILSTVLNVGLSVLLVGPCHMGVTGALLGTTASLFCVILFDPTLVYKTVFHTKPAKYYTIYFRNLLLICATGGLVWLVCLPLRGLTLVNFAIRFVLCMAVPNGLWYLMFRKTEEFAYLKKLLLGLWKRIRGKRRRKVKPATNEQ